MISITQLYGIITDITDAHLQMQQCFTGDLQQAMASTVTLKYPVVIANVTQVNYAYLSKTLTLSLIFLDKRESGDKNILDLENDLELCANDYYKVLNTNTYKEYFRIETATSQKVADRLKDDVAGWQLTLSVKMLNSICVDDLPFNSTFLNNIKL